MLASWGVELKLLPKNASLEHEYWKQRVAEEYRRRGYTVGEEVPIADGKAIDLVASKARERIAIEIETGASNAVKNIRKALDAGFEQVVSVGVSPQFERQTLDALQQARIAPNPALRVLHAAELSRLTNSNAPT